MMMTPSDDDDDDDDTNGAFDPSKYSVGIPPSSLPSSPRPPSKADLYGDDVLEKLLSLHLNLSDESAFDDDDDDDETITTSSKSPPGCNIDDDSFLSLHDLVVQATSTSTSSSSKSKSESKSTPDNYAHLLLDCPDLEGKLNDVRMIASDVDGTLLTSSHEMHPRTADALRRVLDVVRTQSSPPLRHFVLATGKSQAGALGSLGSEMGHLLAKVPGVFIQGLYCVDGDGAVIYERKLGKDETAGAEKLANDNGLSLIGYDGNSIWATASSSPKHVAEVHDKYGEPRPTVVDSFADYAAGFNKVLFMDDNVVYLDREIRPKLEALARKYDCAVTQAVPTMLELLPPGSSKGVGVEKLCAALGVDPTKELLAIGDGENDKEMLELASIGVAVGNAGTAAARAADIVLDETNNEGGAGVAIEVFGLRDILRNSS